MGFIQGFNENAKIAQIVNIRRPAWAWGIYRSAAFVRGVEPPGLDGTQPDRTGALSVVQDGVERSRENNNGRIRLSVRQAAQRIGVTPTTAAKAIHDLQRKGWLVVYRKASLGVAGEARGHEYEITEIALPSALERKEDHKDGKHPRPRQLYVSWMPGKDYPVADVRSNNPTGRNRKNQKPVIDSMTNEQDHVIETMTGRLKNYDEQANFGGPSVIESMTSLLPGGVGERPHDDHPAAQVTRGRYR